MEISPEQRLKNLSNLVLRYTETSRVHNGKYKPPTYHEEKHVIAETAKQLAEEVLLFLNGELNSIVDDGDIPF